MKWAEIRFISAFLSVSALLAPSLAAAEEGEAVLTKAELDQMLAPIALYPDPLLAQILTASTYPLELVEAARWSKANPDVEGADAVEAVAERRWDPSVKALAAFPRILERMDEDLEWTRRLGDAFLLQEEEVMASIQSLREKAYEVGSLESLDHVTVRREREFIIIEPAHPRVIYVPYYRPTTVYGTWWWPAYQPVCWGTPVRHHSIYYRSRGTVIVWSPGVVVRPSYFITTCDWNRRQVVVVNHHHQHYHHRPIPADGYVRRDWSTYGSERRWQHDPIHRRGVSYRTEALDGRYGRSMASSSSRLTGTSERSLGSMQPVDRGIREERPFPSTRHEAVRGAGEMPFSRNSRDRREATPVRPNGPTQPVEWHPRSFNNEPAERAPRRVTTSPGRQTATGHPVRTVTTPGPRGTRISPDELSAIEAQRHGERMDAWVLSRARDHRQERNSESTSPGLRVRPELNDPAVRPTRPVPSQPQRGERREGRGRPQ